MPKNRSTHNHTAKQSKDAISASTSSNKKQKEKAKQNHTLSPEQLQELENMFLMGGITSYQAAKFLHIAPKTAKIYFTDWAEQLISDPEHIPWVQKEKRARARALESLTKQIIPVMTTLTWFEKILHLLLIAKKEKKTDKDTLDQARSTSTDTDTSNKISNTERIVRLNRIYLSELQQQYFSIDMMPPAEAILELELEKYIAEKQKISTVTNT